ncbi:AraC family transcriptional regulator ligand-binding domain-containing protein [Tropicimonas sp. TH_r6]|uniref:helix-turn-helix domain-containing protein n=1 Tax=Tropicimonas sp. TH_r6 TaxID=3082085 RepID=UPI002955D818|nr:AraC family transcriptional regulator ligand-binding domain-containing protein [Tropicimonas sp. TH_r6]MDV7143581.1 AraC family transcriptional regulator ligand-binding domain-containing protein [Tropicimonas sp. TH_r6]
MHGKLVNLIELAHVVDLLDRFAGRLIVDRALRSAGLDRTMLDGVSGFIPYASEAVLIDTVARAIGDRHLGARIGQAYEYSAYGAYAHFVLGAPDLASALERGRRALLFTHPGSEITLRETETHLVVGRDSKGLSVVGHHHLDEGALFVIGHVVRHFLGSEWTPDWVEVPETNARELAVLEDLLGTTIRAGAPVPGIAIRVSDLTAVNPGPPQPERTISLGELGRLMDIAPAQTMEAAVVQMLTITFPTGLTDENTVAGLLAIGPRSLQRALKDEATTFRQVRARVVSDRARSLLSETDMSLAEIGKLLGYSDPRGFRRAFKDATGLSPSAFRKAEQAR